MNENKYKCLPQVVIIAAVTLIGICFVASMLIIDEYAKDDCFDTIEETTMQMSDMFVHTMAQSQTQLTLFADILAANSSNPDELLRTYMRNFCKTQSFAAVCVHRANGTTVSEGFHPHTDDNILSFQSEVERLPYISDVCSEGETRAENYVYQAVPIVRSEEVVGILYGYISLETFPLFISSTAYDGKCHFYIVNGEDGSFMMDEYHRNENNTGEEPPLGNAFDGSMGERETKTGYSMDEMQRRIKNGENGYFIFRSQKTGKWIYTYYMPMGINNWSMQMTIDEPTAFANYYNVKGTVIVLMICVIALALLIIGVIMLQNRYIRKRDLANMRKSDYINKVQGALISAHDNPDFVHQALKIIAKESTAETVMLLILSGKTIENVYYWPSQDKTAAMLLVGIDIGEVFPKVYDALISGDSIFVDDELIRNGPSKEARELLKALDVSNMLLVPILDNDGTLKAAITTVNVPTEKNRPEMLECLTRDFYMAITNLENYTIIRNMGAIDYLTGVKNRNSYESELKNLITLNADSLWCLYVDVNGLHEINNSKGHEAGDIMLATVARTIKNILGDKWVYRLGGDEFVAFAKDSSHEAFMSFKYRIIDELAEKGYHVSVGFEGTGKNENRVFSVEKIVKTAEAIMYKEKKAFYEKNMLPADRARLKPDRTEEANVQKDEGGTV